MLPTKFWAEMSWRDFAAADMSKVVAVLPVAAIEQHGPHLPVGVDMFINEGYFARAVKRIPADMPVLILPFQAIGKSNEHIEYPGTLTFSLETVTHAWTEIGDSVARTGCRKLIFMNSHGGNVPSSTRWRGSCACAIACSPSTPPGIDSGYPADLFSPAGARARHPWRRGETSLMLAFSPQTVRMSEAQNFVSSAIGDRAGVSPSSRHSADRLRLDGQRLASARHGRRRFQGDGRKRRSLRRHAAEALLDLLRDVLAFDLTRLGHGPLANPKQQPAQ